MSKYAEGRRFEYLVRDMLRASGMIVTRCAGSKPFDLVASSELTTYAVECKSSPMRDSQAATLYGDLIQKLRIPNDGLCAMSPLLFYKNICGNLDLHTRATFVFNGQIYRPVFDGSKLTEVAT